MSSKRFGSVFWDNLGGEVGACHFYTKGPTAADVSTSYNATKSRYGL